MGDDFNNLFDINERIKRHVVANNIGIDTALSTKELLDELGEKDPQGRSTLIREMLMSLGGGVDPRRQAHIEAMNELDNVAVPVLMESGVPGLEDGFAKFKRRRKFPDVQKAKELVTEWVERRGPGMLTLSGPTGTGKSHLAQAAATLLQPDDDYDGMSVRCPVIYREETAMMSELRRGARNGTLDDMLLQLCEVRWLVIDDLGMTALSDWGNEQIDRIINARWSNADHVRTLVTTNLLSDELPVRVASRLRDTQRGRAILIDADDFRTAQK